MFTIDSRLLVQSQKPDIRTPHLSWQTRLCLCLRVLLGDISTQYFKVFLFI